MQSYAYRKYILRIVILNQMNELKVTDEELDVIIHALEDFIDIEHDRLIDKTIIASKLVDRFKIVLSKLVDNFKLVLNEETVKNTKIEG